MLQKWNWCNLTPVARLLSQRNHPSLQVFLSFLGLAQLLTDMKNSDREGGNYLPEKIILRNGANSGRCVAVTVTNKSSRTLEKKRFYCESGRVEYPGKETITPGGTDCALFVKKSFTACGSVGVLVFDLVEKHRRRLAILFSNPFNFILYKQTFAIHITDNLEATPEKLYNDMYYLGDCLQNYTRGEDNNMQMSRILRHDGVKVTASMTPECKSILTVLVEDTSEP